MKTYLLIVAFAICGCIHSEEQSRANFAAENYIRSMLGDPKGFESVSFSQVQKRRHATALDSTLNYVGIDTSNHKRAHQYIDSENDQRPDLAINNTKDLYNIEHHRLTYYLMTYACRVDSNGYRKYMKYQLELDTSFKVFNVKDITNGHTRRE